MLTEAIARAGQREPLRLAVGVLLGQGNWPKQDGLQKVSRGKILGDRLDLPK